MNSKANGQYRNRRAAREGAFPLTRASVPGCRSALSTTGVSVLWGNCSVKEGKGIIVIVLTIGEVGNTGLEVGDELEVGELAVAEFAGATVADMLGVNV